MIDLRSDTQTQPSPGMRAAMASAEVGDEQRREDPTVLALERRVAAFLGQEEAVYLPTATMGNQIALQIRKAAPKQMGPVANMEAAVVVGGFDPIDIRDIHKGHLSRILDGEPFYPPDLILPARDLLLRPRKRTFEARIVERLQQIIERSGFESA